MIIDVGRLPVHLERWWRFTGHRRRIWDVKGPFKVHWIIRKVLGSEALVVFKFLEAAIAFDGVSRQGWLPVHLEHWRRFTGHGRRLWVTKTPFKVHGFASCIFCVWEEGFHKGQNESSVYFDGFNRV